MSDKKSNVKDNGSKKEHFKPRNLGAAGFPIMEFKGQDFDHSNEFLKFKTNWRNHVATAYHTKLECIEKEGTLPVAPPIDLEALAAMAPRDKNPILNMIFEQTVKSRTAEFEKLASRLLSETETYFTTLWFQFGLSMQNQIRCLKDYAAAEIEKNSVWLWKAFQAICLGNTSVIAKDSKMSALISLTGMKKSAKYESIHTYYERWKLSYQAYTDGGNVKLSESEKVELFIASLDENYTQLVTDLKNTSLLGGDTTPKTLDEAFHVASNYLTSAPTSTVDTRAAFYTADQRAAYEKRQKPKRYPKPDVKADPKPDRKPAKETKPVPAAAAAVKKAGRQGGKKKLSREDWLKKIVCHGCNERGHFVKDCPNVADVDDVDDDDDDEEVVAVVPKSNRKKVNGIVSKMVALNASVPNRYLVALDSCAYTSVLCNDVFASDIVVGQCDPLVNWNGESHSNLASAQFHPFGYCEINDKTPINLLSEFEVKSRFKFFEKFPEYLIVYVGSVEVKFTMDVDRRQYVADWREYKDIFTYSPSPKMLGVVINSVRQNEAMYTKREVALAREARTKIAHSGYMSKEDIMRLASSSGNIINWNLNRVDVQRAIDIYGSQHVLHGRSRIIRPDTRVDRSEPIPKRSQDLYTDKFFIGGLCFMLGNAKPLDILFVKPLAGESEIHLGKVFQEFIAILLSYKFETNIIYSDADTAVIAQLDGHGRVRVEPCAAGDHVNEAESRIKTVKERF